jgi:hypothetical protein
MLLLPVLVALSAGAAPQVKLAAPGLTYVGVEASKAELISQHFAQQLLLNGIQVTTQAEISTLIGVERQKELLGCGDSETAQCLAELAGALGVDGVITGSIAKLDDGFLLNLKVVSSHDASVMAAASHRAVKESELIDWLTQIAPATAAQLRAVKSGAKGGDVGVEAHAGLRSKSWVPLVVGGAFLIAGVLLVANAYVIQGQLRNGDGQLVNDPQAPSKLNSAVSQGDLSQTLGWVGIGVAAACIATAAGFYVFGADGPQMSALLTRDAGFVTVKLRWP